MFKCGDENGKRCKNSALCHLCDGQRLLKLPKPRSPVKRTSHKKKDGMDFEKKVTKKWNKSVSQTSIRRPNSGAIYDLPGDIATPDDLMECKERGTTTTKGEKTFTMQLSWIIKIAGESARAGKRHWYIPFSFKGHDEVFLVKSFDHELELLQTIEALKNKIKELEGG